MGAASSAVQADLERPCVQGRVCQSFEDVNGSTRFSHENVEPSTLAPQ
jgi:hypothetical protein